MPVPPRTVTRRGFLAGAGGVAAAMLAGCGGDDGDNDGGASQAASKWEFTDDRGQKVTLDKRPERVVAYVTCGAALWDFGVRPVGAFGPQRTASGGKELQAGNLDLSSVQSVGNSWDDLNLEKLAALRPDLLVTGLTGEEPTDMWVLNDQALAEKVKQVVPIVALSEYKVTLPKAIERYGQLAQALGADLDAPAVAGARDDFTKASDELRQAAAAKPGLKVLVVYSDKEGVYVAKPEYFADLAYYRELGVDIVSGGGADEYWEKLSWEQVAKYPADLILTDSRSFSLTQQQMAEYPTWRQLPAVRAGQLGGWSAEQRFNYLLAAPVIRQVADVVNKARTDIV